jgi:hypothetical protein
MLWMRSSNARTPQSHAGTIWNDLIAATWDRKTGTKTAKMGRNYRNLTWLTRIRHDPCK